MLNGLKRTNGSTKGNAPLGIFDGHVHGLAGGADAASGTPMAVALGVPEYMVKTDINGNITEAKPVVPESNRPFSHGTISSYLAFMRVAESDQLCRPMSMIIVTDGQPDPWASQGGTKLYKRLRSVRRLLGVKTYIVAYTEGVYANTTTFARTHEIACAASGGNDTIAPCAGGNAHGGLPVRETCGRHLPQYCRRSGE